MIGRLKGLRLKAVRVRENMQMRPIFRIAIGIDTISIAISIPTVFSPFKDTYSLNPLTPTAFTP